MEPRIDRRRKRFPRWLLPRFGLRSLLLLVTVGCLALGWHVERVRRQRLAVAELEKGGAEIAYYTSAEDDYGDDKDAIKNPRTVGEWIEWLTPNRLRIALGIDFFRRVDSVTFDYEVVDYPHLLSRLRDLRGLRQLTLYYALDEDLAFIGEIQTLTDLELVCSEITDKGLVHLANLRRLKGVSLHGSPIRGPGLVYLAKLPHLESLDLSDTQLVDANAGYLLGLRRLKSLSLSDTLIGDAGLSRLAGLPRLEELYLGDTLVSDEGLASLDSLANLRVLRLDGTAITDDGLRVLGDFGSLENISVDRTAATAAGADSLRRRLPKSFVYASQLDSNLAARCNDELEVEQPVEAQSRQGSEKTVPYPQDAIDWKASGDRAVFEGRWSDAGQAYDRAMSANPEYSGYWFAYEYEFSRLLSNDPAERRRYCAKISKTRHYKMYPMDLLHLRLVAPQRYTSQAQVASRGLENEFEFTLPQPTGLEALRYCRLAKFTDAVRQPTPDEDDDCGRYWFSRAMAHQYLGQVDQARECYTRGAKWFARHMHGRRGDALVLLEAEALRREAENLIYR